MMTSPIEGDGPSDRLVLRLEPVGPVEVSDLTSSFSALARLYDRHYRSGGEPAPKLFITKLETGSIIAEVAPYVVILGTVVSSMDTAMIVSDFTRRLSKGIRAFSDPTAPALPGPSPSNADAADIREFVKPLIGRKGASLGIKHARYHKRDENRETIAEYVFDEAEINRATINIEESLASKKLLEIELEDQDVHHETGSILREVTLVFEQASRKPGRERGRTADKAVVLDASPKALPVYFRKSFRDLKDRMVRGEVNPLTNSVFIVDVHVTRIDGDPKAYVVTEVHDVLPIDSE